MIGTEDSRSSILGVLVEAMHPSLLNQAARDGARTLFLDVPLALHDFGPQNLSRRETLARFRDFVAVQRAVLQHGWPAVAVNTGRLLCIHCAYRALTSVWLGALADLLLRPWRPQAELDR